MPRTVPSGHAASSVSGMKGDPRSSARYIRESAAWLARIRAADCALCGRPVDMRLPRTVPAGPTVEHTFPVRLILRSTVTWDDAVAMACDQRHWAVAHRRCQDRQGQRASTETKRRRPSREW